MAEVCIEGEELAVASVVRIFLYQRLLNFSSLLSSRFSNGLRRVPAPVCVLWGRGGGGGAEFAVAGTWGGGGGGGAD